MAGQFVASYNQAVFKTKWPNGQILKHSHCCPSHVFTCQLFGLANEDDYPYNSGLFGSTGECKYGVGMRAPYMAISG